MAHETATHATRTADLSRVRHLVLIGNGPEALVMAAQLQGKREWDVVRVSDEESWLEGWKEKEQRRATEFLRAPGVHHPHRNKMALRDFAKKSKREKEMIVSATKMGPLPSLNLYTDFAREKVVRELNANLVQVNEEDVVSIEKLTGPECKTLAVPDGTCCKVTFASGNVVYSKAVVYCKSPQVKTLPDWAAEAEKNAPPGVLLHSQDLDCRKCDFTGKRVAVVGGGMTAAQLAWYASKHGATVTMLTRHRIKKQEMDFDLGWQGMKLHRSFRWDHQTPSQRLSICEGARPQATINKLMWEALQDCLRDNRLELIQSCAITEASWNGSEWSIAVKSTLGDERNRRRMFEEEDAPVVPAKVEADFIWLATGCSDDCTSEKLLRTVQEKYPTRLVDGYPVLDDNLLAWPGLPLYFIGSLTMLSVGPAASLHPGWIQAAQKIFSHLLGESFPHAGQVEESRLKEEAKQTVQRPKSLVEEDELGGRTKHEVEKYSWTDEEFLVTVRIYVNEPLQKEDVKVRFKKQGLELWALTRDNAYHLSVPLLYKPILEERCRVKVNEAKGRISLVLHKYDNHEWRFLKG